MNISYSSFKTYKECPRQFHLKSRKVPTAPENKINALFGSVVGVVFEEFYVRKAWEEVNPPKVLRDIYRNTLKRVCLSYNRSGRDFLDFSDPSSNYKGFAPLEKDVIKALKNGWDTIRNNDLIGSDAAAEVVLDVTDPITSFKMVGRADFVVTSRTHGRIILDGKGSRHHTKYLDPDQLYWYAYQHYLNVGEYPAKVGFLNWRYSGEKGISWVPLNPEVISTFLEKWENVARRVKNDMFPARPEQNRCGFCPYQNAEFCPEGYSILGMDSFRVDNWEDHG